MTYAALAQALNSIQDIPFAEYAWKTRPAGDYGVYQLDFEASALNGDDGKNDRAMEGSVDLFLTAPDASKVAEVEGALESVCGGSWKLSTHTYEQETRLIHYEWTFQTLEG